MAYNKDKRTDCDKDEGDVRKGQSKGKTQKRRSGKKNGSRRANSNYSNDSADVGVPGGINNDFSWYNTVPELTTGAANFSFARPVGTTVTPTAGDIDSRILELYINATDGDNGTEVRRIPNSIPGIMTIHWHPTFGISTLPNSALNTVSRQLYSFVRHANSGAANYDAPDLMIYLLAMDSLYSMYNEAIRVYGYLNTYNARNRYLPKYLVQALGWDFEDLIKNQAQFFWAINHYCYKISSMAVPNFMSYYLRHMWLNSHAYRDKPGSKSQIYAFVEDSVFKYVDSLSSANLGGLDRIDVPKQKTVSKWMDLMETLVNPILASEDMGIMSGDILKAFGDNNLFNVTPLPQGYAMDPVYSEEVLTQIQNLSIMPKFYDVVANGTTYTSNLKQIVSDSDAEGYLYTNPALGFEGIKTEEDIQRIAVCTVDKLLTSDEEVPSEAFTMVATRLMNRTDETYEGSNYVITYWKDNSSCSSEIVTEIKMFYFNRGESVSVSLDYEGIVFTDTGSLMNSIHYASAIAALSKFDWQPTLPIVVETETEGRPFANFIGYYQDTNNYNLMNSHDLTKLHETALVSEFFIPQIASATRKPSNFEGK